MSKIKPIKDNFLNYPTPLVSVVCNTYNHGLFLKETIESFLKQETNFGVEILIHDDSSTDNTAEIIKEYASRFGFIRPYFQESNIYSRGLKPRDFQFPRVRGRYVAVCEGDDYWTDKRKLLKQFRIMEKFPFLSLSFHLVRSKGNLQYTYPVPSQSILRFSQMVMTHYIPTCSLFFRFDSLDRNALKNFNRIKMGDIVIQLLLLNKGKSFCHFEYMGVYRTHSGGITQNRQHLKKGRVNYIKLYWKMLFNVRLIYSPVLILALVKNCLGYLLDAGRKKI